MLNKTFQQISKEANRAELSHSTSVIQSALHRKHRPIWRQKEVRGGISQ